MEDLDPLECPSCGTDTETSRLNHPRLTDGRLKEGWVCESCNKGYTVEYVATEKRLMSSEVDSGA